MSSPIRPASHRRLAARFWATFPPFLALLLLTGAALSACAELRLPDPSVTPVEAPLEQSHEDLAKEAEAFWTAGNFPQSELLYSRLLERQLTREERLLALDRLAASAFQARHFYQAKQALDRQAAADGAVLATWAWHGLYIKTLGALDRPDLLENHLTWLLAHTELPFEVRSRAALAFAEILGRNGDLVRAVNLLAQTHRQAPDRQAKLALENEYAAQLREYGAEHLQGLARLVGASGGNTFPHALIQREAQRRAKPAFSQRPALAPERQQPAQTAAAGALLAQNALRTRTDQPAALLGSGGPVRLALVLPLSGRFAPTGQKVLRGAGAAQARLTAQGRSVDIRAINSEAPDWREQLAALPPDCTVVGGPLRGETLRDMGAAGTFAARAVFAFLPDLAATQEGRQAWRFYPSLKDQARALVNLTADSLGIRSVAVLAPKNGYGKRMADIFQAEAKAKGLRLAASEAYPPDDHPRWVHSVGRLLKIPEGFRHNKSLPLPMPDFGAVFVPEDWTQAELLVSNFHFFEGQHLVFLGPDLWSVALDSAKDIDDTYFQLSACPGAWWPETRGAQALQAFLDKSQDKAQDKSQADFWVALGHDFVFFAARLALPRDWTPEALNLRLAAAAQGLEFSMAPLTWDAEGRARQELYLFSPRKDGKVLVNPEELRAAATKARERREKRLAYSRELHKTKKQGPASGSLTREPKDERSARP